MHGIRFQGVDPTGLAFIDDLSAQGLAAHAAFSGLVNLIRPNAETGLTLGTQFPSLAGTIYALLKPDVIDHGTREYFELKPVSHKHRPDLQQLDAYQMVGYDLVLGPGFGYRRGNSSVLLQSFPIGTFVPILITVGPDVYGLKFWPVDDPMSGGHRGDGLIWYKLTPFKRPPTRPQPLPVLVDVREYSGERVKIEVWDPVWVPAFDRITFMDSLPSPQIIVGASAVSAL